MAFTGTGFEGTVGETEFAQMLSAGADHGVLGAYNDSSLSAAKVIGSRTMLVQPGYVSAPGIIGHLDVAANATAAAAPSPALSGSQQRIDLLVARFDWSGAGTSTLVMKAGTQSATPVPPTLTQNPGTLFEVPLRQGLLTAAVQGEYTTTTMLDRRYWIEQGHYVLSSTTQLPPASVGAIAVRPDTNQILVLGAGGWNTFKAESDTGWSDLGITPAGFTGSVFARRFNGFVELQFEWGKGSSSTAPDTEFGITIPPPYRPGGKGIDKPLIAGEKRVCRLYVLPNGNANLGPMTLSAGERVRGHVSYIGE